MKENLNFKPVAVVILFCLVCPLLVFLFWSRLAGAVFFVLGIYVASRIYRVYNRSKVNDMLSDSLPNGQTPLGDQGKIIKIPLLDHEGHDLSPEVAQQRIAEAKAKAGPKDTVVGVRIRPEQKAAR
jgi:hypothetical protein